MFLGPWDGILGQLSSTAPDHLPEDIAVKLGGKKNAIRFLDGKYILYQPYRTKLSEERYVLKVRDTFADEIYTRTSKATDPVNAGIEGKAFVSYLDAKHYGNLIGEDIKFGDKIGVFIEKKISKNLDESSIRHYEVALNILCSRLHNIRFNVLTFEAISGIFNYMTCRQKQGQELIETTRPMKETSKQKYLFLVNRDYSPGGINPERKTPLLASLHVVEQHEEKKRREIW